MAQKKTTYPTARAKQNGNGTANLGFTWGETVGRKYIQRINIIKVARGMDDLFGIPDLKCHPLKGDRKGQFAISLTGFHRLIFTLQGEQLEVVMVEEVSKHYDD